MAFELLLRARRDDQVGDLRRQEAAQPAHPLDLADLLVDAPFEVLVQDAQLLRLRLQLARLLPDLVEQASILDGDHGLCGEVRREPDLLLGKRGDFIAGERKDTDRRPLAQKRHAKVRSELEQLLEAERLILGIGQRILGMNRPALQRSTSNHTAAARTQGMVQCILYRFARKSKVRRYSIGVPILKEDRPLVGRTETCRRFG